MSEAIEVLCAGIVVADHVCTPVPHVPAAGELVMADGMLLTMVVTPHGTIHAVTGLLPVLEQVVPAPLTTPK